MDDRLSNGESSHYRFLVAESDGQVVAGYACWGPIPGTVASADLYWIVVHPQFQGKRIGAALLQAAEEWMASAGRTRVYVETSTRPQYLPPGRSMPRAGTSSRRSWRISTLRGMGRRCF